MFHSWLDDADRRNVVLVAPDGRVVGYQSFLLQDGGRRVLANALRIDPSLKGLGIGRRFMRLCREMLLGMDEEVRVPILGNLKLLDRDST